MEAARLDNGFDDAESDMKTSAATPSPARAIISSAAAADNTIFRFLDLPAELRNVIYSMLLINSKPIRFRTVVLVTEDLYGSYLCRYAEADISATVLGTSRQINVEATPILYAGNTFKFDYGASPEDHLRRFLLMMGTSRQHIRHVSLERYHTQQALRSTLNLLKGAKALQTFELGYYLPQCFVQDPDKRYRTYYKPGKNLQLLLPWLRSLKKARKGRDELASVAQVFRLAEVLHKYYINDQEHQMDCQKRRRLFEEMIKQLDEALA